jgi:hypothetical protein
MLIEGRLTLSLAVWQGVAMDSLKFHRGPPCPTLRRLTAVSEVAHPQDGQSSTPFVTPRHTPKTRSKVLIRVNRIWKKIK